MKERPILFSGPMVSAILDGRKTMTRRVMKPKKSTERFVFENKAFSRYKFSKMWSNIDGQYCAFFETGPTEDSAYGYAESFECPYGQPGDRLWVKETYQEAIVNGKAGHIYRADPLWASSTKAFRGFNWKPSIFMPRKASRITLEITNVRVERLNDISDEDALCEGVREENVIVGASCAGGMHRELTEYRYFYDGGYEEGYDDIVTAFKALWESINGPGSWDVNPWVWVVEFKRVEDNR